MTTNWNRKQWDHADLVTVKLTEYRIEALGITAPMPERIDDCIIVGMPPKGFIWDYADVKDGVETVAVAHLCGKVARIDRAPVAEVTQADSPGAG